MEVLSRAQKIIFSLATLGVIILFAAIINMPQNKASAIGLCDSVGTPTFKVDINGQTFSSDASIIVPVGSILPFTVWTYAEPSSPNSISYPGGSNTYPGPCGYLGCPGRSYTTSAINSADKIVVFVSQYCSGGVPPEATLTINIGLPAAACTIDTFTCTGINPDLVWKTSNCTNVSIDNSVGSNLSAQGTYTPAKFSTTYTLTANGKKSQATCPTPNPALNAVWQENNGKSISKTVTPGSPISVPLNFSNTGQKGSQINNTLCSVGSVNGVSYSDVSAACDNTTLIAP